MGNAIYQGLAAPGPLNRFSKNLAQLIMSATPSHVQIFGSVGPNGVCLRMREVVIVTRLFFRFQCHFTFHAHRYRSARWTGPDWLYCLDHL